MKIFARRGSEKGSKAANNLHEQCLEKSQGVTHGIGIEMEEG